MDLRKVKIETERLVILPITMKYKEVIFREFQEPVTLYMYPKAPEKIGETEQFIKESLDGLKSGDNLQLVILDKNTGEFFGCAGLHELDKKNPEIGIWIKKSAHGKRYGREAMTAVKKWADKNIDYDYIRYPVAAQNIASRKIPESLGGKVMKEEDKKMLSGRTYHMLEYWIPKSHGLL